MGQAVPLQLHPWTGEALEPAEVQRLQSRMDEAVDQLIAEGKALLPGQENSPGFRLSRPHPALAEFSAEHGLFALDAMVEKQTGDVLVDSYFRYHLMQIVKDMLEAHYAHATNLEEARGLPLPVGLSLIRLFEIAPRQAHEGIPYGDRREPKELWEEYSRLRKQTRVVTGTPPFEREYFEREALEYVTGERKKEIEKIIAEIDEISPKLRWVVDHYSRNYNARVGQFNRVSRVLLGDLVYSVMQTGQADLLDMVVDEIAAQLPRKQRLAYNLLDSLYAAGMDGYLQLYDHDRLIQLSKRIEAIAKRHRDFELIRENDEVISGPFSRRSFYDASYHLVRMLREPRIFELFVFRGKRDIATEPVEGKQSRVYADSIDISDVQESVARAVKGINSQYGVFPVPPAEKRFFPKIGVEDDLLMVGGRWSWMGGTERQNRQHQMGFQSMLGWAMLASGQTFQDPRMYERVNWSMSKDPPFTFDRAMRMQMLRHMPRSLWADYVERDVEWLGGAIFMDLPVPGTFAYHFAGVSEDRMFGDNAQAFYGLLGLWAAEELGVSVDRRLWQAMDFHWRKAQQVGDEGEPAGWARGFYNLDVPQSMEANQRNALRNLQASGQPDLMMTAAGTLALTVTERYLGTPEDRRNLKLPSGASGKDREEGLRWLRENFTMTGDASDHEWYYRMWMMQQLGLATGVRNFNGVDWIRDVTAEMINRQNDDGLWRDEGRVQPDAVSTAFGLLYVSATLNPVAISKIELSNGAWNNHPNDLFNFVEYVSQQYEVDTAWQVVDLGMELYMLQDSPILMISTDEAFELSDQEIQTLRGYIDAGGLLITNSEKGQAEQRSFSDLYKQLFPESGEKGPWQSIDRNHDIFTLHQKVRQIQPSSVRIVDNGLRLQAIHFSRDVTRDLERNDQLRSDAFSLLSNVYLYSVGYNPRRQRLVSNIVVEDPSVTPMSAMKLARVAHAGEDNPEPFAMSQLQQLAHNELRLDLAVDSVESSAIDATYPMAWLSTTGAVDEPISAADANALRQWIEQGGMLWVEATGGSKEAVASARGVVAAVMPDAALRPLPYGDPILSGIRDEAGRLITGYDNTRVRYRLYALHRMQPTARPRLQAIMVGDRPGIVLSEEDLTMGVAGFDHWSIFGYNQKSARQLLLNGLLVAGSK